jgi:hypothetical protein
MARIDPEERRRALAREVARFPKRISSDKAQRLLRLLTEEG